MMKDIRNFKPDVMFYHHPCADGFGAYVIAQSVSPTIDFIPYDHKMKIPDAQVRNKNILLIDCCFNREKLLHLKSIATDVYVLDHHEGNRQSVGDLDFCYFDINKAGIHLAWNFFFPEREIKPAIVHYIEDRDLYTFKYDNTINFCAYVDYLKFDLAKWKKLFNIWWYNREEIKIISAKGEILQEQYDEFVNTCLQNAFQIKIADEFGGYKIHAVNVPRRFNSGAAQALRRLYPESVFTLAFSIEIINGVLSVRLSFRSKNFNLIPLAQSLGGGGHSRAAGAIVTFDVFLKLIKFDKLNEILIQSLSPHKIEKYIIEKNWKKFPLKNEEDARLYRNGQEEILICLNDKYSDFYEANLRALQKISRYEKLDLAFVVQNILSLQ